MELETINALACCLDDVYNTSPSGSRKVTSRLDNNELTLTFQTIKNFARDSHLHIESGSCKEEGAQIINKKVKEIKKLFKSQTGRELVLDQIKQTDNFETISISAFNPNRVMKYTFNVRFEIK